MNVSNDGAANLCADNDCGVRGSDSELTMAMKKLSKENAREDDFLVINCLRNQNQVDNVG
jgi:hypothetical protein